MTDLDTLRAKRDAARKELSDWCDPPEPFEAAMNKDLDALLRLHAQVTTLENAEKLDQQVRDEKVTAREVAGWANAADFLRQRGEGA